ncbi:unnamed protein product [Camellia sinensis]
MLWRLNWYLENLSLTFAAAKPNECCKQWFSPTVESQANGSVVSELLLLRVWGMGAAKQWLQRVANCTNISQWIVATTTHLQRELNLRSLIHWLLID